MLLVKKCNFFLYLFSIKIRIKIRFNNDLDSKQTFCYYKEKLFHSPKNRIFPRGLTHAFSQKYHLFLYLFSVKIRLEIMLNKVWDRKQCFLTIKTKFFKVSNVFFSKGVNPCFWSKNSIFFYPFVIGKKRTRNEV